MRRTVQATRRSVTARRTRRTGERTQANARPPDESGAVLVLALVFMIATALVVTGLTAWSGNDIKNIGNLKVARSALYASGGATQTAISNVRYTYPASTSPGFCPSPARGPAASVDTGRRVHRCVVCYNTVNEEARRSRVVTLAAYPPRNAGPELLGYPLRAGAADLRRFHEQQRQRLQYDRASCGTATTVNSWVVRRGPS